MRARGPLVPEGRQQRRHLGNRRARGAAAPRFPERLGVPAVTLSALGQEDSVHRRRRGCSRSPAARRCRRQKLPGSGAAHGDSVLSQQHVGGAAPSKGKSSFGRPPAGPRGRVGPRPHGIAAPPDGAPGRHLHRCRWGWCLSFSSSSSSAGSSRTSLRSREKMRRAWDADKAPAPQGSERGPGVGSLAPRRQGTREQRAGGPGRRHGCGMPAWRPDSLAGCWRWADSSCDQAAGVHRETGAGAGPSPGRRHLLH